MAIFYHGDTTISSLDCVRWLAQATAPKSTVEAIEPVLQGLSLSV